MSVVVYLMSLFVQIYGELEVRMQRTLEIFLGFGMSMQGVRTCGDYMFSGHTVVVTMLNFFISECKY